MLLRKRFLRRLQLSVGYRNYATLKSTFRTVHLSEIRRRPANCKYGYASFAEK